MVFVFPSVVPWDLCPPYCNVCQVAFSPSAPTALTLPHLYPCQISQSTSLCLAWVKPHSHWLFHSDPPIFGTRVFFFPHHNLIQTEYSLTCKYRSPHNSHQVELSAWKGPEIKDKMVQKPSRPSLCVFLRKNQLLSHSCGFLISKRCVTCRQKHVTGMVFMVCCTHNGCGTWQLRCLYRYTQSIEHLCTQGRTLKD